MIDMKGKSNSRNLSFQETSNNTSMTTMCYPKGDIRSICLRTPFALHFTALHVEPSGKPTDEEPSSHHRKTASSPSHHHVHVLDASSHALFMSQDYTSRRSKMC